MGKKRTTLGTQLYVALIVQLVGMALVALLGIVSIFQYPKELRWVMLIIMPIALGIATLIYWCYFDAFRKNEPQRIRRLTKVLLILIIVGLVLFVWSAVMLPNSRQFTSEINANINSKTIMLNGVLGASVFAITLYELQREKIRDISVFDKRLWIVVLAIEAFFFLSVLFGKGSVLGVTNPAEVISSFINGASQTLIVCWITNPEKFYVDENQGVVPPAGIV
ncbi:MAG: hypothetical protein J5717_07445 [Lachnospiraceae bacterium]|nr:hypothetical protein [Lachnospiraceae bacterium]